MEDVKDTHVIHPAQLSQLSLFFSPPLGILPRATLREHLLFLCTLRRWVSFQRCVRHPVPMYLGRWYKTL